VPGRQRQDRNNYRFVPLAPLPRDLVELDEIDRVVHHLVAVSASNARTFELDDEQDTIRKQQAVHAKAAATEVELKDNVANAFAPGRHQGLPEYRQSFAQIVVEDIHALAPFLRLLLLNLKTLFSGAPSELIGNGLPGGRYEVLAGSAIPSRGTYWH
jgi:flagellar biosynthesis/type III secretory pathway protein FliH